MDPRDLCPGCFETTASGACPLCGYDRRRAPPQIALTPDSQLNAGQFVTGRLLGKPGGFGLTYLAWDTRLETRVAIKEFLPRDLAGRDPASQAVTPHSNEDAESFRFGLAQFIQEARTLAKFNHPNVVRVRQFFESNGTAYLVMDYYEGISLAELLKEKGRIPESSAIGIMIPILDGLRQVHGMGILHRDIKPQNIYITKDRVPILLDFGAARMAMGERSQSLSVVLTPGYAPYEQYHRKGGQGPWTDVYACAATLYSLVSGKVPEEVTARIVRDEQIPLQNMGLGLSPALCAAVERAMALDPRSRPRSAQEFQELLLGNRPSEAPSRAPAPGVSGPEKSQAAPGVSTPPPDATYPCAACNAQLPLHRATYPVEGGVFPCPRCRNSVRLPPISQIAAFREVLPDAGPVLDSDPPVLEPVYAELPPRPAVTPSPEPTMAARPATSGEPRYKVYDGRGGAAVMTRTEIWALLRQGRLNGSTEVTPEGSSEWRTLGESPEFKRILDQLGKEAPSSRAIREPAPLMKRATAKALDWTVLALLLLPPILAWQRSTKAVMGSPESQAALARVLPTPSLTAVKQPPPSIYGSTDAGGEDARRARAAEAEWQKMQRDLADQQNKARLAEHEREQQKETERAAKAKKSLDEKLDAINGRSGSTVFLVILAFQILYSGIVTALFGGSPGKLLLGLRIRKEDGSDPGTFPSLVRCLAELPSAFLFLGYLKALFSDERQTFHDQLAGTQVQMK